MIDYNQTNNNIFHKAMKETSSICEKQQRAAGRWEAQTGSRYEYIPEQHSEQESTQVGSDGLVHVIVPGVYLYFIR